MVLLLLSFAKKQQLLFAVAQVADLLPSKIPRGSKLEEKLSPKRQNRLLAKVRVYFRFYSNTQANVYWRQYQHPHPQNDCTKRIA